MSYKIYIFNTLYRSLLKNHHFTTIDHVIYDLLSNLNKNIIHI